VTVTDDASRTVTIDRKPARIVSLAPANTEIVTAIGVPLGELVGVTTYDDYPASVKSLPKMGDFMNPNLEAITAARPDVILITGGIQNDVLGKLLGTGAKVVVIDPKTLDGLYRSIQMLGKVTGRGPGAASVVAGMRAAVSSIGARVATKGPTRVFMEIGYNPLFTVGKGTLIDDMLTAAGGANVVDGAGYVPYSAEQVIKDDPVVYFATRGGMGDPGAISGRPGFDKITAVKNGSVVVLEDNLVSRPGPRVVEGIEAMARAMHPYAFKQ
jgi:iron complex transport system substrate-binding protein